MDTENNCYAPEGKLQEPIKFVYSWMQYVYCYGCIITLGQRLRNKDLSKYLSGLEMGPPYPKFTSIEIDTADKNDWFFFSLLILIILGTTQADKNFT